MPATKTPANSNPLEVHEHWFISGPRTRFGGERLVHSHAGGSVPHQHPATGPASYTIDKDEWLLKTGLRGGGRKKFTARPKGEQLPRVELEKWQTEFEIIVGPPTPEKMGSGPGVALPMRMILGHGMRVSRVRAL